MNSINPDTHTNEKKSLSPKWNWTTKLVVGFALVAIALWLLVKFQNFLGPLITAFILAYLIHPIANFIQNKIKLPWRLSVSLIYVLLVLAMLGLITWGGFALLEQIQNLIRFFERNIDKLPDLVAELTNQTILIGPFEFSTSGLNWDEITNEIVRAVQPVLGRVGGFASSIATGAASIVSWWILIVLVSYFLLAESEGIPGRVLNIQIPGYAEDIERMTAEISKIWKGFIRGEILVVLISLILYTITLGGLGLQFFFGLAVIAAVGQLIPYLGAWVTWISFGLVALFQTNPPYNLPSGIYLIIVLGISMVINNIIDNIIRTKVMAETLKVHPAMVLIGALVGVQLFGFIGIVIAAPIMASLKLFLNYIVKKLKDENPWEELELRKPIEKSMRIQWFVKIWEKVKNWVETKWHKNKPSPPEPGEEE